MKNEITKPIVFETTQDYRDLDAQIKEYIDQSKENSEIVIVYAPRVTDLVKDSMKDYFTESEIDEFWHEILDTIVSRYDALYEYTQYNDYHFVDIDLLCDCDICENLEIWMLKSDCPNYEEPLIIHDHFVEFGL